MLQCGHINNTMNNTVHYYYDINIIMICYMCNRWQNATLLPRSRLVHKVDRFVNQRWFSSDPVMI